MNSLPKANGCNYFDGSPAYSEDTLTEYGKRCWHSALNLAAGRLELEMYPAPTTQYQTQYNEGLQRKADEIRGIPWPCPKSTP